MTRTSRPDLIQCLSRILAKHWGTQLPQVELDRWEVVAGADTDDIESRLRLAAHWLRAANEFRLLPYLKYFIERYPELPGLGGWPFPLEAHVELVHMWSAQSLLRGRNPQLAYNVFRFQQMGTYDHGWASVPDQSSLEPARWDVSAGHHYMRLAAEDDGQEHYVAAADAFTRALALREDPSTREAIVEFAALMAYRAGRPLDAEVLAGEATACQGFESGAKRHIGHTILGLVALHRGDLESALAHLSISAQGSASLYLSTRGPHLELARELLDRRESVAVTNYLRELKSQWPEGAKRLDRWIGQVEAGEAPSFPSRTTR